MKAACSWLKLKVFISFSIVVVLLPHEVNINVAAIINNVFFIIISLSVVFNQILHKVHVVEVDCACVVLVHCCDLSHVVVGEGKIEDDEVLLHTLLVGGLGDGHDAALREPAKGHLRGGLAVLGTDAGQQFALDDAV